VIKTFRSKEFANLFAIGKSKIDVRLHKRILLRLDTLDQALSLEGLVIEGYDFHALRGFKPTRYTIHINGPWCITFEFLEGHVYQVDLEQYH
jgi:toxin HigB-1